MTEATLLNRLKRFGYGKHHGPMAKACAEAHAEINRLRIELAAMVDCGEHPCAFCFEMAQRAKRSLEQG